MAQGLTVSSACQLIQGEGNIKHCRLCVPELGNLSSPQFTLLSQPPQLTTAQSPEDPTEGRPAPLSPALDPSEVPRPFFFELAAF